MSCKGVSVPVGSTKMGACGQFVSASNLMKAIVPLHPPPQPARLARTPEDARARWRDDEFRFPPYQYQSQFLLSNGESLRCVNSGEREILMGFGPQRAHFCFPASEIKKSAEKYEDERLSLIGDSFCVLSFGWVAGHLCRAVRPVASEKNCWCAGPCTSLLRKNGGLSACGSLVAIRGTFT